MIDGWFYFYLIFYLNPKAKYFGRLTENKVGYLKLDTQESGYNLFVYVLRQLLSNGSFYVGAFDQMSPFFVSCALTNLKDLYKTHKRVWQKVIM